MYIGWQCRRDGIESMGTRPVPPAEIWSKRAEKRKKLDELKRLEDKRLIELANKYR